MDRRGLSVTIVALMLAVMMASSTTASPGMNAMQSPGSEDGQPTAEHNTLYLFGNAGLTNCNSKFNNTNADSAEYGEDTRGGSGELNMKLTCRMEPTLDEDVVLAIGEMIEMNFMLNLMDNGPMVRKPVTVVAKTSTFHWRRVAAKLQSKNSIHFPMEKTKSCGHFL